MRNLILFITLFFCNLLYSQIDPEANIFLDAKPRWAHVAFDSTAINYKKKNGMNYYIAPSGHRYLIDKNYAYMIHTDFYSGFSGGLIEKIDMSDGKQIWSNYFDERNNIGKEYTSHYFINEQGQLELLDFINFENNPLPYWTLGKITNRRYDINNGTLIQSNIPSQSDSSRAELYFNFNYTLLHKDSSGAYNYFISTVRNNMFQIEKHHFDTAFHLIKKDSIVDTVIYPKVFDNFFLVPLNNNFDTLVRMINSYATSQHKVGDPMSIVLDFFDYNLNKLYRLDLSNKVDQVHQFNFFNVQENSFTLISSEELFNGEYPLYRLIVFDFRGNKLEEIVLPSFKTDFGNANCSLKYRNELGSLILSQKEYVLPNGRPELRLLFYKTDGKGNLFLKKVVPLIDSFFIGAAQMTWLENNDILLTAPYSFKNTNRNYWQRQRFISSRWDLKELNLSTDISKTKSENTLDITYYPIPIIDNKLQWKSNQIIEGQIILYSMNGSIRQRIDIRDHQGVVKLPEGFNSQFVIAFYDKQKTLLHSRLVY